MDSVKNWLKYNAEKIISEISLCKKKLIKVNALKK